MIMDTMRATCADCGYTSTLRGLTLHDCTITEMGGQCEDYPACGHTDGDGCQTLPTHTSAYYRDNPAATHLGCDHNTGYCEYEPWEDEDEDEGVYWCEDCQLLADIDHVHTADAFDEAVQH